MSSEQDLIAAALLIRPEMVEIGELGKARDFIEHAMHMLDLQIAAIRHNLGEPQKAENARWKAKATGAERIKAKQRVRLQNAFGEVHRLIRAERNRLNAERQVTRDRRFVQLAKKRMTEETFLEIWHIIDREEQQPMPRPTADELDLANIVAACLSDLNESVYRRGAMLTFLEAARLVAGVKCPDLEPVDFLKAQYPELSQEKLEQALAAYNSE